MILDTLLSPERSLAKLDLSSKKKVFEFIADFFTASEQTQLHQPDQLVDLLTSREKLGSTAIGKGIAIPHCRCAKVSEPIGLLMTLEKPVGFDAPDEQKVDIILVIVVPDENHDTHLPMLTNLASLFDSLDFRNQIRKAQTSEELYYTVINFERRAEQ